MKKLHRMPALCCGAICVLVAGCATVDPKHDYGKVSQQVVEATGQSSSYQPDQEAAVEAHVAALLADGLTSDEAVQVCLLNNPSFQAAWMDVGMARADLVQAGLLSNPSLFTSLRLPSGGGLANLEFSLAQNIAELWQIPVRKRAANRSLDRQILVLTRRAAELVSETKAAYIRALGAQHVHAIARENLAIAKQLVDLAVARKDAGEGSELDVNLSRSAAQEAQLAVETTRLSEAEARRRLAQLLGLTEDPTTLALKDAFQQAGPGALDVQGLIQLAAGKRLDIRAAEQAAAQAEAVVREQYARVFKNVEIGVALERAERQRQGGRDLLADTARASIANGGLTAPDIQPRSERRQNTDLIIGPSVALEVPIFDQNQAQIAKAEFALQQARKTLDALERSAVQDVRNVADRLTTAWAVVRFYREELIPLAQRSLEMNRDAYRAGSTSILAVMEAQRFLLDARRRHVEAVQSATQTVPELELAVGLPLTAMGDAVKSPPAGASTQPATSSNQRKEPE